MTDSALLDAARILDGNPVPCFVIDEAHVVVYWNEALAQLSGIPAVEVLGTHNQWRAFYPVHRPVLADLVLDDAPVEVFDKFYKGKLRSSVLCKGGWEAEDFFPTFGDGGCWLAFSAAPIRNSSGRIVGCVETLQDISERKSAELARRDAELQLAAIIAGSPVAMFVVDCAGQVTHWNRACEALTGIPADRMIGQEEIWPAFYPQGQQRQVLAQLLTKQASMEDLEKYYGSRVQPSPLVPGAFVVSDFFPSLGPSGKWLYFMAAPMLDQKGQIAGVIETFIDIGQGPATS